MMRNKNFVALILTHGRPDRVITYKALKKAGYTGPILIVIDDEDETAEKYRELYGEEVVQFSKKEIARDFDEADNFGDRRSIFYARNASFDIAKAFGADYFIQLDDDYTDFRYKFFNDFRYGDKTVRNLDAIFDLYLDFLIRSRAKAVAMSQGGDFIGGAMSTTANAVKTKRKAMNTFFCSTKNRFPFIGRINEDVNTYTHLGSQGNLFLTILSVGINQIQTQANKGGMTELYLDSGTYIKSFYSVIFQPSSVKIGTMGDEYKRLHHSINWRMTVPMILSESWRKKSEEKKKAPNGKK